MQRMAIKIIMVMVLVGLQGCAQLGTYRVASKELSQILLPVKDSLVQTDKKPLSFPTTVAILMAPSNNTQVVPDTTLRVAAEALKKELLKNTKFINGVSIISSGDIKEKISLQDIRNLYGVDIVIIVSFEQDQRSTQNSFSMLTDIAIVPAFLIPSVKLETITVIDGKIIHIPSNAIVFRSSGVNERKWFITPYSSSKNRDTVTNESLKSLSGAVEQFGSNVSNKLAELNSFDMAMAVSLDKMIKEQQAENSVVTAAQKTNSNDSWQKVDSYKSSGGGSFGIMEVMVLMALGAISLRRKS